MFVLRKRQIEAVVSSPGRFYVDKVQSGRNMQNDFGESGSYPRLVHEFGYGPGVLGILHIKVGQ